MAENIASVNISTENSDSVCQDNACDIEDKILYEKYILDVNSDSDGIPYEKTKFDFYCKDIDSDCDDLFGSDNNLNCKWHRVAGTDEAPHLISFNAGEKRLGTWKRNRVLDPINMFNFFVTEELIYNMVLATNKNAQFKLNNSTSKGKLWESWKDVTVTEMKVYLGILLDMGLKSLNRFRDYWQESHEYTSVFTRKRFLQIFWMFQVSYTYTDETDKRKRQEDRIHQYIYYLEKKFRDYYIPNREITLYTSSLDNNGKVNFVTFDPNDNANCGIRLFVIADCKTSYVCTLFVHFRNRSTDQFKKQQLPLSNQIVLHLYEKLRESNRKSKGHCLFLDRHYASLVLAKELSHRNCYMTATIYRNKKYLPISVTEPILPGDILAYRYENYVLVSWRHQQVVTMLSTCDTAPHQAVKKSPHCIRKQICKSTLVSSFLKNISSGIKLDLYPASYKFIGKKFSSWRELFFWSLEVAVTNAHIIHTSQETFVPDFQPISRMQFVKTLIYQLIRDFRTHPLSLGGHQRLNGKLHILLKQENGIKMKCTVCSNYNIDPKLIWTKYFCRSCIWQPSLHVGDCFQRYHSLRYYKKKPSINGEFKVLPEVSDDETYEKISIKQEACDGDDPHCDTPEGMSIMPEYVEIKQEVIDMESE